MLDKDGSGVFEITFEDKGWQVGETYTLIEFGSTDFDADDFAFTNGDGFGGAFTLTDDSLLLTLYAVPEPSTRGLMIVGLLLSGAAARRGLRHPRNPRQRADAGKRGRC